MPAVLHAPFSYKHILYVKPKHLGCKKVQSQEEPAAKSSDIK